MNPTLYLFKKEIENGTRFLKRLINQLTSFRFRLLFKPFGSY